ncbi:MAG TPA: cache domain-containing protein, partial [Pyrinomonadaceae bacterium]|nr:cache domain-containing protein [Pyrinomonadaceae bacterium]
MLLRPKLFLTFALITAVPLLILSGVGFLYATTSATASMRAELERDVASAKIAIESAVSFRHRELIDFASSRIVLDYLEKRRHSASKGSANDAQHGSLLSEGDALLIDSVTHLISNKGFGSIFAHNSEGQMLFGFEANATDSGAPIAVRSMRLGETAPDPNVWKMAPGEIICANRNQAVAGPVLHCVTPVSDGGTTIGALTGDVRLDRVITEAAQLAELRGSPTLSVNSAIVLDRSGYIVYHQNDAVKYQNVNDTLHEFGPVATAMLNGRSGQQVFTSDQGEQLLAMYTQLDAADLSLLLVRNYTSATRGLRRWGWSTVVISGVIGLGLATLLALMYQRKERSIER